MEQERQVVERLYAGELATDLARELGVHKSTISRVFRAAKMEAPWRPVPTLNVEEWQRRLNHGVAKAMAAGRHPGSTPKVTPDVKQAIIDEVNGTNSTFKSIAEKYGITSSTVGRIVNAIRVRPGPSMPQSLEEILTDLLGNS